MIENDTSLQGITSQEYNEGKSDLSNRAEKPIPNDVYIPSLRLGLVWVETESKSLGRVINSTMLSSRALKFSHSAFIAKKPNVYIFYRKAPPPPAAAAAAASSTSPHQLAASSSSSSFSSPAVKDEKSGRNKNNDEEAFEKIFIMEINSAKWGSHDFSKEGLASIISEAIAEGTIPSQNIKDRLALN